MADASKARTFRWSDETNNQIKDIGKLLNENDTDVIIRAIEYLHTNRKTVAEEIFRKRLEEIKKD